MADTRSEWTRPAAALRGAVEHARWIADDAPYYARWTSMWRAFFLALGIFLCILGGQCLVVDTFVMASERPPQEVTPATLFGTAPTLPTADRHMQPPDWAPWSLLSAGAVIILYSLTINKQG